MGKVIKLKLAGSKSADPLDEAIKDMQAIVGLMDYEGNEIAEFDQQSVAQLVGWMEELKSLRVEIGEI